MKLGIEERFQFDSPDKYGVQDDLNSPDSARKQLKSLSSEDSSPTKSVSSHNTDTQGSTSASSPSKQGRSKEKLEVSSSIEKFLKERVAREVFTT